VIHVVLTGLHDYTVGKFLDAAGAPLQGILCTDPYDRVFRRKTLPGGTYVLSDFERLSPARRAQAAMLADALDASDAARLLNHPARVLGRCRLLRRLHDEGLNPYTVHWLEQLPDEVRYPVFLRLEDDHSGARSDLLRSRGEIEAAAESLQRRGKARARMIVVEFQDTIDGNGEYRKYGAFCVHGRIVPRHLFFGRSWNLKRPSNHRDEQFDEEEAFMEGNPHEAQLQRIFSLAGVDFGRIDYAMVDGRVCTWEINTNPMIAIPEDATTGRAGAFNALFHARFRDALRAIDTPSAGHVTLPRMRVGVRETVWELRDRLKRRLRGR
jgi:hypothetical protein